MGNGNYEPKTGPGPGKFNLIVSFQKEATPGELDQWELTFQAVSDLLLTATEGKQELGKIYVCNNSHGGKNADIWIGDLQTGADARIWEDFTHLGLNANDEQLKVFIVVHELGHYLYSLADEYPGQGWGRCRGIPESYQSVNPWELPNGCIMERYWQEGDYFERSLDSESLKPGPTTTFCCQSNHDKALGPNTGNPGFAPDDAHNTRQNDRHEGKSCWETIVWAYPDLQPAPMLEPSGVRLKSDPIGWIKLAEELRFALVLDRSGSMGVQGGHPMDGVIHGASFWVDSALPGDFLGIVGFDDAVSTYPPVSGLAQITNDPASRDAAVAFAESLYPRNFTAMGNALRHALGMILPPGTKQAATQVIVLFSDGKHNTGEDPMDVLPDLVAQGVRVYTIGFGPDADIIRLKALAEGTGGKFCQIDTGTDPASTQAEIENALITLSADVRDNGGIVTVGAADLRVPAPPPEAPLPGTTRLAAMDHPDHEERKHSVLIDRGASVATFALQWQGKLPLDLELVTPHGRKITAFCKDDNVRHGQRGPYRFFQIREPEPGNWEYRVRLASGEQTFQKAAGRGGQVRYHHYVFVESKEVHFEITSPRRSYEKDESVQVIGQATAGGTLTNLCVKGWVDGPDGKREGIELSDRDHVVRGSSPGRFVAGFRPWTNGHYQITVVADNSKPSAIILRSAKEGPDCMGAESHPVPAFVRRANLSILVGKPEMRRASPEPNVLRRGYKGRLILKLDGIPWLPGTSRLHLGSDVKVTEDVPVTCETGHPSFWIDVQPTARVGLRDATLSTGGSRFQMEGIIRVESRNLQKPAETG